MKDRHENENPFREFSKGSLGVRGQCVERQTNSTCKSPLDELPVRGIDIEEVPVEIVIRRLLTR